MIDALYFLIFIRVLLDFVGFYKPNPVWDFLYIILFFIFGIVLLAGHKPDIPPTPDGWIFIGIGVIWGLFTYLKSTGMIAKKNNGDTIQLKSDPKE